MNKKQRTLVRLFSKAAHTARNYRRDLALTRLADELGATETSKLTGWTMQHIRNARVATRGNG